MVISQYYHKFNKSVLRLTLQSRRFFQPEVDSKHSESEWNRDSDNSTYENLLIVSKLPTLKVRRLRTMAIEIYKILHKESPSQGMV